MEYLPFGELLVDEHKNSYNSPFKYNGKEFDEETGNYFYGARYYDPKWSIFISVDPLAEKFPSWNPYHYVHQNPINLIDPTGMEAETNQNDPPWWEKIASAVKKTLNDSHNRRSKDWERMKSDLKVMKEKISESTDVSFTIWGEKKAGDNQASKGLINEKSPKKSIEVTGDDINPLNTLLKYIFSSSEKEKDGYPITSDKSKKSDQFILIKYSSNSRENNVIWMNGTSNLEQAQNDSIETMQTATPKNRRYSYTYDVDSIKITRWVKLLQIVTSSEISVTK